MSNDEKAEFSTFFVHSIKYFEQNTEGRKNEKEKQIFDENQRLDTINASLAYAAEHVLSQSGYNNTKKDPETSNRTAKLLEERQKARDIGNYEEERQLTMQIKKSKRVDNTNSKIEMVNSISKSHTEATFMDKLDSWIVGTRGCRRREFKRSVDDPVLLQSGCQITNGVCIFNAV